MEEKINKIIERSQDCLEDVEDIKNLLLILRNDIIPEYTYKQDSAEERLDALYKYRLLRKYHSLFNVVIDKAEDLEEILNIIVEIRSERI